MRLAAFLSLILSLLAAPAALASPADALRHCTGRFVNPITAPCWDCIFPLTIGSVPIWRGKGVRVDAPNPSSPICACGTPVPRIGLTIGYW